MDEAAVERWLGYLASLEKRFAGLPSNPRHALGRQVERMVARRLMVRGYVVNGTPHKAPFDLLVDDCCRVEVKASRYHGTPHSDGRGRYQFCLHNRADVLVAVCVVEGGYHCLVIPYGELGGAGNIAVWSADPAVYAGRWARFLERWDLVDEAVKAARERDYQLRLV